MVHVLLGARCPPRADDAHDVLVTFRPDHQDESTPNWADSNEAILSHGMFIIEDLEVINTGREQLARFSETNAVLALVREILCTVPLDLHRSSLSR